MNKIIPKLSFHNIKDTELDDYAKDKVNRINTVPAFAAVNPSAAQVENKTIEYVKAVVKSDDGTKADTANKNKVRNELENMLTQQAYHCALIANGDLVIYLTSGYEAKDLQGKTTGELFPPQNILFRDYGKNSGELVPDWNKVKDARNYTTQVYADVNNPSGSILKEVTDNPSKVTIGGLTSGQKVWVRVRANGGSTGHSDWSDPATKFVP